MYKYADKDHNTVTNLLTGASGIHPGVWQWEEYQKWKDAGGITEPYQTAEEIAAELAAIAESEAKKTYEAENAALVSVGGIIYKGGESSASTISAAVNLAQALGETTVTLVDANLDEHTMPLADALAVAAAVGVPARAAYFKFVRAVKAARAKK